MAEISQLQVETALKEVIDPYLEQDLVTAKAVKGIVVDGDTVSVDIVLGYPAKGVKEALAGRLREKVLAIKGVKAAHVTVDSRIVRHGVQKGVKPIPGVKNIIAVASRIPARAPSADKARARLTAVVDLPTPPLPDATAIMFLTPGPQFPGQRAYRP